MSDTTIIDRMLSENNGIVTTAEVVTKNISKPVFMYYVRKNGLKKLAHGIYASEEAWPDEFQLLQLQYPKIVFSHESALFLNGMSEGEPDPVSVTVPRGYHSKNMEESDLRVYRVSPEKVDLGLVELESPTGVVVRSYNLERTLCDLLRSQSKVDYQEMIAAFKSYVQRKDKNIPQLMRYGSIFRVSNKMKPYLEVLL
jgi:predicted transcriptional regulator of viral defense system